MVNAGKSAVEAAFGVTLGRRFVSAAIAHQCPALGGESHASRSRRIPVPGGTVTPRQYFNRRFRPVLSGQSGSRPREPQPDLKPILLAGQKGFEIDSLSSDFYQRTIELRSGSDQGKGSTTRQ